MNTIWNSSDDKNVKRKIFLVDDEPDHCFLYQIILQDAGYECNSYTVQPQKTLWSSGVNTFQNYVIFTIFKSQLKMKS